MIVEINWRHSCSKIFGDFVAEKKNMRHDLICMYQTSQNDDFCKLISLPKFHALLRLNRLLGIYGNASR